MSEMTEYDLDRMFDDSDQYEEPENIDYYEIVKGSASGLAWFIRFDDEFPFPKQEWLPKSKVTINAEEKCITMPAWLAIEKGLI